MSGISQQLLCLKFSRGRKKREAKPWNIIKSFGSLWIQLLREKQGDLGNTMFPLRNLWGFSRCFFCLFCFLFFHLRGFLNNKVFFWTSFPSAEEGSCLVPWEKPALAGTEKRCLDGNFCSDSNLDAEQAGAFVLPVFAIPVENLGELHGSFLCCLFLSLLPGKRVWVGD